MKASLLFLIAIIFLSCSGETTETSTPPPASLANVKTAERNPALIGELRTMIKNHQDIQKEYSKVNGMEKEERLALDARKDSTLKAHCEKARTILEQHGYPNTDMVGKSGADQYWFMMQQCDAAFQEKALAAMEAEVKRGKANAENFATSLDRLRLRTGKEQVYGTQVNYSQKGQAQVKSLADSVNVNQRRTEIGLPKLERALNNLTIKHYNMNKKFYEGRGVQQPVLYTE